MLDFTKMKDDELKAMITRFNACCNETVVPHHSAPSLMNRIKKSIIGNDSVVEKEMAEDFENVTLVKQIYTRLFKSIIDGDEAQLAAWIRAGGSPLQIIPEQFAPPVAIKGKNYQLGDSSLFHDACLIGLTSIVKLLIKHVDRKAIDNRLANGAGKGLYPLRVAIKNGHKDVVKLLVENGANIFDPNLDQIEDSAHENMSQLLRQNRTKAGDILDLIVIQIYSFLTPREAFNVTGKSEIKRILTNNWSAVINNNKSFYEIGKRLANTDLSEKSISEVLNEITISPEQSQTCSNSTHVEVANTTLLYSANLQRSHEQEVKKPVVSPPAIGELRPS